METKTFTGRDMNEALNALRATLGSDALILQTRRVPVGNTAGVEITAMPEEVKPDKAAPGEREPLAKTPSSPRASRSVKKSEELKESRQLRNPPASENGQLSDSISEIQELRRDIAEMKSLFRLVAPTFGRGTIVEELTAQGVAPEIINRLTREVHIDKGTTEREQMRHALTRMITTGGDVETRGFRRECLTLIGPTGVGKTTTIVKLTTHLLRRGERRIGWISLDSRRIAGSEQLVVYAGVLGIPCEVVDNSQGLQHALDRFSPCDLVLIDTAGVNPREADDMSELAELLQYIPDLRCTLLLSATTNGRDMLDWLPLYERLGFDSLLFTKMDESKYFGSLLNATLTCRRPISYITSEQNITSSLELAKSDMLAHRLLP